VPSAISIQVQVGANAPRSRHSQRECHPQLSESHSLVRCAGQMRPYSDIHRQLMMCHGPCAFHLSSADCEVLNVDRYHRHPDGYQIIADTMLKKNCRHKFTSRLVIMQIYYSCKKANLVLTNHTSLGFSIYSGNESLVDKKASTSRNDCCLFLLFLHKSGQHNIASEEELPRTYGGHLRIGETRNSDNGENAHATPPTMGKLKLLMVS
jgi:hypothetical protein